MRNLKRLAMNLLMDNEYVVYAIEDFQREDGERLNYWTDLVAPDDQCYDLQLYCYKGDVPSVYIHQQGYDKPFIEFFVDLDIFMPAVSMSTYKVELIFKNTFSLEVVAGDEFEARRIAQAKLDNGDLDDMELGSSRAELGTVEWDYD